MLGFASFPAIDYYARGRTVDPLQAAVAMAFFTGIVSVLITGLVAYPALRRLIERGALTGARTVVIGAALGNIPAVIAILIRLLRPGEDDVAAIVGGNSGAIFFGTFLGLVCSALFWWIAGKHVAANNQGSEYRDSPPD